MTIIRTRGFAMRVSRALPAGCLFVGRGGLRGGAPRGGAGSDPQPIEPPEPTKPEITPPQPGERPSQEPPGPTTNPPGPDTPPTNPPSTPPIPTKPSGPSAQRSEPGCF